MRTHTIPLGAVVLPLWLAGACLPDTDLTDEDPSASPPPSAQGSLVDPAPGSADVPRNLGALLVHVPDLAVAGALRLIDRAGASEALGAPETVACAEASQGSGVCVRFALQRALLPLTSYTVRPGRTGSLGDFQTTAVLDEAPPEASGLSFVAAGWCARLTLRSSEPASVSLRVTAGDVSVDASAGKGLLAIDAPVPLRGLPADADALVVVRLEDRAGNATELPPLPMRTPKDAPPIVITEVLANAAGTEPAQEFVEIMNAGAETLALEGLKLEDATGQDILPAATLDPGARALIVPSGFSGTPDKDVAPAPATLLIRVDARLGGDGLGNAGEVVRLVDPDGTLVSSYGGWVNVSATSWSGKSVQRISAAACDHPSSWNGKPLPATPGW